MGAFEEYQIIRHGIKLVDAHVVELHAVKNREVAKDEEYNNSLSVGMNFGESPAGEASDEMLAFVRVAVDVKDKDADEPFIRYVVVVRGVFARERELPEAHFQNGVRGLAVPLLLPYARAALASVSGLMDNSAVYIPTMDILKSMATNAANE